MLNMEGIEIKRVLLALLLFIIFDSMFLSGQNIIQEVSEKIEDARGREFAKSKGGTESNKLNVVTEKVRGGKYAFEHYVNNRGERSELAMVKSEIGREYWYGWSMLIPEDFDFSGSYSIVAQMASYPNQSYRKFKCGANGPYMVITSDGSLDFRLQFAGRKEDSDCIKYMLIQDISEYRGKWLDFVINAKWTGNDDGFLKMWLKADDNNYFQKINYRGPTWWNDEDEGPYFKMGLYMGDPGWKGPSERTILTDEFRMADEFSSFNDVAPPGAAERKKEAGEGNLEYIIYPSSLNKSDIPVMVYTPPGYYDSAQRYPSVYNFHGSGGGSPERQWDRIYKTLTDGIAKGLVRHFIYIFVNGMGDRFYANYREDSLFIEQSIVSELIPFIDKRYRTIPSKEYRAADGFSMGGFGALMVAMKHPALFSSVVSYGAALIDVDRAVRPGLFLDESHFNEYNPSALVLRNQEQIRNQLAVRIVCGDKDGLLPNNIKFKHLLDSLNILSEFIIVPGVAHDTRGLYEKTGIASLRFMEAAGQNMSVNSERQTMYNLPGLRVSDNNRFIITRDGKPFFWLGSTSWAVMQRCSKVDTDNQPSVLRYFDNMKSKSFNVLQCRLIGKSDTYLNAKGDAPFIDEDFTNPMIKPGSDNDYWDFADWFIDEAEKRGIYLALLPIWMNAYSDDHPVIKDPSVAYRYGNFIGMRYRNRTNIIWVLGGDGASTTKRDETNPLRLAMLRAMAEGIADGTNGIDYQDGKADYSTTLMSFHPHGSGHSSAINLHNEEWLDFNMIQTTTRFEFTNYEYVRRDYARTPPKPVLDSEVAYEYSISLRSDEREGSYKGLRIRPWEVRKAAYWDVFSGGFGHTYGHRSFIGWVLEGEKLGNGADIPWFKSEAIDAPGSFQLQHLRKLIESYPFLERIPDQSLIVDGPENPLDHVVATRSKTSTWAFVYFPSGMPVVIDLEKLKKKSIMAKWFNPRTGSYSKPEKIRANGIRKFLPPSSGIDNDWVLILD